MASIAHNLRSLLILWSVAHHGIALAAGRHHSGYISGGVGIPEFSLELSRKATDTDTTEASVAYAPNLPLTGLVGVSLFGLSLGASLDIDGTKEDVETDTPNEKVKTDYASYGASYYFDRVGVSGSYTSLRGMNIVSVTGVTADTIDSDVTSHRSDIKVTDQSGNLWVAPLAFNFSLHDFFDLASPSRGSGIALVAVGSYDTLSIEARQALIPAAYRSSYGSDQTFMSGEFESLGARFGPAFVLDIFGIYFEGLITFGSGTQKVVYQNEGEVDQTTGNKVDQTTDRQSDKQDLYLATGYKGDTVFTAIEYNMESPGYSLTSINVATIRSNLKWVLGVRL